MHRFNPCQDVYPYHLVLLLLTFEDDIDLIPFQALLSDKVALQSVLLRHMTRGALISSAFPPGPTPLVTGAGERVTVTAFPNQVTITSVLAVAHIIDVDNEASNGVVHVVDSVF